MNGQSEHVARILSELQQKLADADSSAVWLVLGDALAELDELGPHSADGQPWTELVRQFHEGLGYSGLSIGHLQKVRRVRNFVRKVIKSENLSFTDREIVAARLSALEVAERLYALDSERGQAALRACIRDQRKFVDMQRSYQEYIEQNLDRLPRKQKALREKRRRSLADDVAMVERIILSNAQVFFGTNTVALTWFPPDKCSPFLKATDVGFRIAGLGEDCTLGVELLSDVTHSTKDPTGLFAEVEFQSSFFDLYWLFVRADAPKVAWLLALMDEVFIDRVGLLGLDEDRVHVYRRPAPRRPDIDRRHLLAAKWYDVHSSLRYRPFDYARLQGEASVTGAKAIPLYAHNEKLNLTWSVSLE